MFHFSQNETEMSAFGYIFETVTGSIATCIDRKCSRNSIQPHLQNFPKQRVFYSLFDLSCFDACIFWICLARSKWLCLCVEIIVFSNVPLRNVIIQLYFNPSVYFKFIPVFILNVSSMWFRSTWIDSCEHILLLLISHLLGLILRCQQKTNYVRLK